MKVNNIDVHVRHCCIVHGCKFGDDDCPVCNAEHKQKYLCEICTDGFEKIYKMKEIKRIFIKENRKMKIKKIEKLK